MRIIFILTAILSLVLPAAAQDMGPGISGGPGLHGGKGRRSRQPQTSEADKQKRKADDATYKAALDNIPDQPKADPWRNAR